MCFICIYFIHKHTIGLSLGYKQYITKWCIYTTMLECKELINIMTVSEYNYALPGRRNNATYSSPLINLK